ncbi:MAG: AIR synthase [Clostridiales bacterium]|jgi:hydrogenase expression/formation protein HypE|nr:AIR synthase [Clostridiales bacterium]
MRIGKLTNRELKDNVIDLIGIKRPEVLSSAGISKDCAAIKCDDIILLTSDPITAANADAGRLAVVVSSNDIAAGGGEPFCCLVTIIAPSSATAADVGAVMRDIESEAKNLNIDVVGGHTEFSPHVNRLIVSCTMLGRTKKLAGKKIKDGDSIIMTKYAAIEGTIIIADDAPQEVLGLTDGERAEIKELSKSLSVLEESRAALECGISLMHDVTEGGIFGAVYEICLAGGVGADIYADNIPVLGVTKKICGRLGLEPRKLISSGSMLIVTESPGELLAKLEQKGIKASKIGEINNTSRVRVFQKDGNYNIIESEEDEISKITGGI